MAELNEVVQLIGKEKVILFEKLTKQIEEKYEMETLWNPGGKLWDYEYKYRRGGKTLCSFYMKEDTLGFMIIFGKAEREKIEAIRNELSKDLLQVYEEAAIYHDGKWVMFLLENDVWFDDFMKLLSVKRKPNR